MVAAIITHDTSVAANAKHHFSWSAVTPHRDSVAPAMPSVQ